MITNKKNICCRIFKEQIDLIKQLKPDERAEVLYCAINNAFNQFENQNDNQIENQNENAYVSVSVSDIGKCIINLLSKNIVCKEFSNNYGGKRIGSGRKSNQKNQNNQNNHNEQTETETIKEKEKPNQFDEFWETYKPVSGRDGTCVAKGSKSRCQEKYSKIIKREDPGKIIVGLKNYLDYCRENRICSCGAEVFLNQRRWENEYKTQETEYGYNPRL